MEAVVGPLHGSARRSYSKYLGNRMRELESDRMLQPDERDQGVAAKRQAVVLFRNHWGLGGRDCGIGPSDSQ